MIKSAGPKPHTSAAPEPLAGSGGGGGGEQSLPPASTVVAANANNPVPVHPALRNETLKDLNDHNFSNIDGFGIFRGVS